MKKNETAPAWGPSRLGAMGELKVGVVGLGLLGSALAERLSNADFLVFGYDLRQECLEKLQLSGGTPTDSATEVFGKCSIVVLSLPNSSIVADLIAQTQIPSGRVVVDTTTGDPEHALQHARSMSQKEGQYVEANIAGSSAQARKGEAVVFLGADPSSKTAADRAVDSTFPEASTFLDVNVVSVLDAISTRRVHVGPVGSASKFKLVHNLILGLHRAVLAEGLSFAHALGFDEQTALEILQDTPAASAIMSTKGPKMVSGDFEPQATLSQHLKDVRLIVDLARKHGVLAPLSDEHRQLLERAESLGWGAQDNSAVIQTYRGRQFDGGECDGGE